VHRIGQEKDVNVYRFITENTVEDGIVALLEYKQKLFDSVIPKLQEKVITKEFVHIFERELMN
jgi:SNF2 family DNA or RNA helicase